MVLTGKAILEAVRSGDIVIEPFQPKNLGPNSYDVTLHSKLLVYELAPEGHLDVRAQNPVREITIPDTGFVLEPGILYIGMTSECATSKAYVPMFEGRSSMGRLGINTHITAGFGDVGWGFEKTADGSVICHYPTWTLEITVVHPVKVYPGIRIGQVYFVEPRGEVEWYHGKYGRQRQPQASQSWVDFSAS